MKKTRGAILTVSLTAILLFVYYSYQIINANHINYGQWGDGRKNFYTLTYYLKYNSGTHFTGMNYPYGENIVFTDNQPAVAFILKLLSKFFPSIVDNIHAYLAWSVLFSIVISSFFLYQVLIEFDVGEFHAALFSSLIALLSPQITRLHGDFSLGYTCFIPILLFLLLKFFKDNGSLIISGLIVLTLTFFAFVHIYFVAMGSLFILLMTVFVFLSGPEQIRKNARLITLLTLCAIIPVLIVKGYLMLTDSVTDRPHNPFGFVFNRSRLPDILLHPYSFTGEVVQQLFPKTYIDYSYEGSAYIGLVPILTLLTVSIISFVVFPKLKTKRNWYFLNLMMLSASVVLLFAMAFPFSIPGLEKYFNKYMPDIARQFRCSGRFIWVFYYSSTLYSAVFISYLFQFLSLKRYYVLYWLLVPSVFALWFIEMNMISIRYEIEFKNSSFQSNEKAESKRLMQSLQIAGKKVQDFQAILFFPFFLDGSEKLVIQSVSSFEGMKASLFTGLPLIDSELSRTSEGQTFSLANLLSSDYLHKDVIRKFPSQKPLLLLKSGSDISPPEWKLINKAHFLFADGVNRYYELPLSVFADSTAEIKKLLAINRSKLISHGDYMSDDSADNVIVRRYEDEPKNYAVFGHGAHYANDVDVNFMAGTLPNARDSTEYAASVWVYSDPRRATFPAIHLIQTNIYGKEVGRYEMDPYYSTNTFGKWVMAEVKFILWDKRNKIYMRARDSYGSYDEVMIRPRSVNVFTAIENDSTFMYNNYPIR